jgi:F0F1-type ATP synthase membrane subunit a
MPCAKKSPPNNHPREVAARGRTDRTIRNQAAAASLGGLFLLAATVPAACAVARPVGAELIHEFIARTLCDNTGEAGMRFFPLVFSVFMFMLTANLLGMFPMPSRSPARSW